MFLVSALAFVWITTAAFGHFVLGAWPSFGEALWQSMAHLIESGSLADDNTDAERAIGLIQVLAGLVFLAGIILTVVTETVQRALSRIHGSDPAISRQGHLLVVGFNPALEEMARRLGHYLQEDQIPETVVLLPEQLSHSREEAKRALSVSSTRSTVMVADVESDGFARACAGDAERILILSPDGDPDDSDLETLRWAALLADHLAPLGESAPPVGFEIRRHRNVRAFWMSGSGDTDFDVHYGERRYPANFDALVRDRIIGGTLSLAIANPEFASAFLDIAGSLGMAPRLEAPGPHAGTSFAEAREALEPTTLLGLLTGTGPTSSAEYLPEASRKIRPDERLIVIPRSPGHDTRDLRSIDPSQVKVSPSRPGSALLVGFSDATRATIEDLGLIGYDGARLHLLNPEPPAAVPSMVNGSRPVHIEGDPLEPRDLARALDQSNPAIVFVAAPDGAESSAVITGMMISQRSEVPVVVEQYSTRRVRHMRGVDDVLTIVSTAGLVAENIATSSADPALLVATQALFDDPALEIESLTYASRDPLPFDALSAAFGTVGSIPIGIALENEDGAPGYVQTGDHILVLQRVEQA